jgi:polyketide biosynthesis acyl carrier protein
MSLDRQAIFDVVKANTLRVLPDLLPDEVTMDKSLTDLGANSIDRVEVALYSIEDLNLKVPTAQLRAIGDLRALVDLLYRYAAAG